jgi:hypothetical protein
MQGQNAKNLENSLIEILTFSFEFFEQLLTEKNNGKNISEITFALLFRTNFVFSDRFSKVELFGPHYITLGMKKLFQESEPFSRRLNSF